MTRDSTDQEAVPARKPCVPLRCLVSGTGVVLLGLIAPQAGSQSASGVRIIEEMKLDGVKESFSVVSAAAVGPGNRLAVWFPQEHTIRIFDATGAPIGSVGGRGAGPGEFTNSIQGLRWVADSVWVNDVLRSRETLVSATGRVIRTTAVAAPRPDTSLGALGAFVAQMRAADGARIGAAPFRGAAGPTLSVGARAILKVTNDTTATLLAKVPSGDPRWDPQFAYVPQVAYSPAGTMFAFAQVDQLAVRGTITVSAFNTDGDTLFVGRLPYAGVALSARTADSIANARRSRDADGRMMPSPPINPERIPPVLVPLRQLLIGSDGRLWLLTRASTGSRAIILDSRGAPTGSFVVPETSRLLAATATRVWIREEDADGVHSVVRYRVAR